MSCQRIHAARASLITLAMLGSVIGCRSTPTVEPSSSTASSGQALYDRYCAVCHGADGQTVAGVTAPAIGNQAFLAVVDDRFMFVSIAKGRPGRNAFGRRVNKMSPFARSEGGPLESEQIDRIVAHVRSWQTVPSVTPMPYQARGDARLGRSVYGVCAPCHGADGWSLVAPSLAGSTFQEIASDAWIRHTVLHGRSNTAMAPLAVGDKDMGDLIAFLRTLDDQETTRRAQP